MATNAPLARNKAGGFDVAGKRTSFATAFENLALPPWLEMMGTADGSDYTGSTLTFGNPTTSSGYAELRTPAGVDKRAQIRGNIGQKLSSINAIRLRVGSVYMNHIDFNGAVGLISRTSPVTAGVLASSTSVNAINEGGVYIEPYPEGSSARAHTEVLWAHNDAFSKRQNFELWLFPQTGWTYFGFEDQPQFANRWASLAGQDDTVAPRIGFTNKSSTTVEWMRLSSVEMDIWRRWS